MDGVTNDACANSYRPQINDLLEDLFPDILQDNEIKIACLPFNNTAFKSTRRYKSIIAATGQDFEPKLKSFNEDHYYIMGCSIILSRYYGYAIDFRRPFYYDIPNVEGNMRHYRILYNGDYVAIEKTKNAKKITQEDVNELLDNFNNIDLWKEKFPPQSYVFKGFIIANLFNVTTDVSISDFKTSLLKYDKKEDDSFSQGITQVFESIFNLKNLRIGFSKYNRKEQILEKLHYKNVDSFLLNSHNSQACSEALCSHSFNTIFEEKEFFTIADIATSAANFPEESLYQNLNKQAIGSAIFAPIVDNNELEGILEVVSAEKHVLNSINANKLLDIMPYLVDEVQNSKARTQDELELIIQNECTSIHPSVYWKFKLEAKRVWETQHSGSQQEASFRDIVFKKVYPLFGQVDIKGSSHLSQGIQRYRRICCCNYPMQNQF